HRPPARPPRRGAPPQASRRPAQPAPPAVRGGVRGRPHRGRGGGAAAEAAVPGDHRSGLGRRREGLPARDREHPLPLLPRRPALRVRGGALYGYRGNVVVVEGESFANTVAAYDRFMPGSRVTAESLHPFSFTLKDFQVTFIAAGERTGQALDYQAARSEEHTSELQSRENLVCRLL